MKFNQRSGFTLIELLIFSAVFTIAMVGFVVILISFTRVQVRQSAASEVNQQSQFLLQTIQGYIEQSSVIEMPTDVPTSTLKLRMQVNASDPTYIYLSGGALYLKKTEGGQAERLNSNRVTISSASFVKRENPPGHDSVSVVLSVEYNTQNIQERFSQTLNTAIARVSAATFDSNVIPSSTNVYDLGVSSQLWRSVNNLIYFSGSNVGIGNGASNPQQKLVVDGGIMVNPNNVEKPATCDATVRGTMWFTPFGVATDTLQLCVKLGSGSYGWATVY